MKSGILAAIVAAIMSLFGGHQVPSNHTVLAAAADAAATQPVSTSSTALSGGSPGTPPTAATSSISTPIEEAPNSPASSLALDRTVTQLAASVVSLQTALNNFTPQQDTDANFQSQLDALRQEVSSQTFSASASTPLGGGPSNTIAAANRIDQLSGTTLTNVTVSGVSGLTSSDVPDLSGKYLALSGGAVTGLAQFSNASTTLFSAYGPAYFGATATSTFTSAGWLGIGTTTPGSALSVQGVANWTGATTTYYSTGGINLAGGCFAINGACVGGSGGGSGTVGSGVQGQFAFYNAAGTTLTATSSLFLSQSGNIGIGTTSPFMNLAVAGNGYLSGSLNVGDTATTRTNLGLAYATNAVIRSVESNTNIAAWGDSLTYGTGGSGTTYPSVLSSLSDETVNDYGIGGQTSTQIAARMLAATNTYLWPTIIWAGYNDYSTPTTVESDIASMVAALQSVGNNNYLVLSIPTGSNELSGSANYNNIISINAWLASTYGNHYLDVRSYLVSLYNPSIPQDVTDHGNDIVPSSLRFDSIHLNATGYTYLANYIWQNFAILSPAAGAVLTDRNLPSILNPSSGYRQFAVTVLTASTTNGSTLVGPSAGASLLFSALQNTAVGYNALMTATSSSYNTAIGMNALSLNTLGASNVAVGVSALTANTSGGFNTALGYQALASNTTGGSNTALGSSVLSSNTTGSSNVGMGLNALHSNTVGARNTGIGYQALTSNTTASNNTTLGYGSLNLNTTGGNNLALGYQAGYGDGTLADNRSLSDTNMLFIGMYSSRDASISSTTAMTNGIAIGYNAKVLASNQVVLGNDSIITTLLKGSVGIGTTSPTTALQVNGTITPNADNSGTLGNSTYRWNAVYATNGTIQTSDERLKKNIASLDASTSLSDLLALNPVSFNWKDVSAGTSTQLGFIAQQVQPILPNVVSVGADAQQTLGLRYTEFIPVIVSAVQTMYHELTGLEATLAGFAESFTSHRGTFTDQLCVGSTCVTPAQFQAMVAAANASSAGNKSPTSPSNTATLSSDATDTPPIIQINGNNPATVQVGSTYNDLGATITGPQQDLNLGIKASVDGGATTTIDGINVDTSTTSTHTIQYSVTDQNGLISYAERSVNVIAAQSSSTTATTTPDTATSTPSAANDNATMIAANDSASSTDATSTSTSMAQ